jgi:hypothetical protein
MMRTPYKFNSTEGAEWQPWPFGPIDSKQLRNPVPLQSHVNLITENYVTVPVHALMFEGGIRWDCQNGFTYRGYPLQKEK